MPIEVAYLDQGEGAVYHASGVLTGDELIAANDGVMASAATEKPLRYVFFDCNSITGVAVAEAHLRRVAETDVAVARQLSHPVVVAIYAKDDVPFALARMWMVYVEASGWATSVFRRKADAIAWLQAGVAAASGAHAQLRALAEHAAEP